MKIMNLHKRVLALAVCAVMVVGTACTAKPASGTPTGAAPSTAKSTSEASGAALSGDLVYWSNWNQAETQGIVLAQAVEAFQKENPGVKIKVVWNGRENKKVLLPGLESGQQIDLFEQNADLVMTKLGDYLLDCTPYYDQVYPTTNGKTYRESIMSVAVELTEKLKPGGIYGVPYLPGLMTFMYNKDHFETAGIKEVPKTWDEFLDVCEKLKAAGYTPITSDDAYMFMMFGTHLTRLKGEEWLKKCVMDTTGKMWEDPAVLQALKDYDNLVKKGYTAPTMTSNKYPAGQQEIAMGEVSMYWNGTWLVNEVMGTTGPDFNWGQFAYPVFDAAVSDESQVQYNFQIMGINKDTKYPEAAFAFVVYITTGKWDAELAKQAYGVPMSGTGDWPKQLADAKIMFENATYRIINGTALQLNAEKLPIIQENFAKVLSGAITPEQAVEGLK